MHAHVHTNTHMHTHTAIFVATKSFSVSLAHQRVSFKLGWVSSAEKGALAEGELTGDMSIIFQMPPASVICLILFASEILVLVSSEMWLLQLECFFSLSFMLWSSLMVLRLSPCSPKYLGTYWTVCHEPTKECP